jgi:hypothetical protein
MALLKSGTEAIVPVSALEKHTSSPWNGHFQGLKLPFLGPGTTSSKGWTGTKTLAFTLQ